MTEKESKTILKFDSGADGFKAMCIVLGISAFLVLVLGLYFLIANFSQFLAG